MKSSARLADFAVLAVLTVLAFAAGWTLRGRDVDAVLDENDLVAAASNAGSAGETLTVLVDGDYQRLRQVSQASLEVAIERAEELLAEGAVIRTPLLREDAAAQLQRAWAAAMQYDPALAARAQRVRKALGGE